MEQLPKPVKGAHDRTNSLVTVVAAIVDSCVPALGSAVGEGIKTLIRHRLEKSQELLLAELKKGNIYFLTDDQFSEFIPMSYRFFEASRIGENEHILKLLAKIIAKNINKDFKSDKFNRTSFILTGLTLIDLVIIDKFIEYNIDNSSSQNELICLENECITQLNITRGEFYATCNLLSGKGLLLAYETSSLGGGVSIFYVSDFAKQIYQLAQERIT